MLQRGVREGLAAILLETGRPPVEAEGRLCRHVRGGHGHHPWMGYNG
jgi:hypothetical protein